jgi:hypothetical protein
MILLLKLEKNLDESGPQSIIPMDDGKKIRERTVL